MSTMLRLWRAWVALWDRREPATALALTRILIGTVVLWDLATVWRLGLVDVLWAAPPDGAAPGPASWFGAGPSAAHALVLIATISAACIATGTATRLACVAYVVASAQMHHLAPDTDRGVDLLLRVAVGVLALSGSHHRWSVDAWLWRRAGRPLAVDVPAWPRHLLLLQLIWVYFSSGHNKSGAEWFPRGGFTALRNVLSDPHAARFDPAWLHHLTPLTRVATALTMGFELGAPLMLLWVWRAPRRRLAKVARTTWLLLGVTFHLGIALTMQLGIFPYGLLALYPLWL